MVPQLTNLRAGLKFSLRKPVTTLTAILVMGLGLGITASMFTLVNGLLWSEIDLPMEATIVSVRLNDRRDPNRRLGVHVRDFRVLREEAGSFDMLAAYNTQEITFGDLEGEALPRRYPAARVTDNFFHLWGVTPILGRGFNEGEGLVEGVGPVVISHGIWKNLFGGDPDVLGKQVYFNGIVRVIIGVMPEGFLLPVRQELWIPTEWQNSDRRPRERAPRIAVVGRLKPGVKMGDCQNEMDVFVQRFAHEYPETNQNFVSSRVEPYHSIFLGEDSTNLLFIMLVCAILVLVISCANVSNLLMGRAADRTTEMSIRIALGARRIQVLGLIILDSMIIAIFGAIGGSALAHLINSRTWASLQDLELPYWWHMNPDLKVLGFVFGLVVLSGTLSGLIPGLRASRPHVATNLRDDTRTGSNLFLGKLSQVLIALQVALSCALLVAGTSMTLIYQKIESADFPFDTSRVVNAQFNVGTTHIEAEEAVPLFYEELHGKLLEHPQVADATLSSSWRGIGNFDARIELEGDAFDIEEDAHQVNWVRVFDNYFDFFEIPVASGRGFRPTDTADNQKVAVVNQRFVEEHFPEDNPIGRHFRLFSEGEAEPENEFQIVGICPNYWPQPLPNENPTDDIVFYTPYRQDPIRWENIHLKSNQDDPMTLVPVLRRAIYELVPTQAAYDILSFEQGRRESQGGLHIVVYFFLMFALGALFLAGVGLFAVSAFKARQMKREIGIRIALGATSGWIIRLILQQGFLFILVGLILGLATGSTIAKGIQNTIDLYMPLGWGTWVIIAITILSIYGIAVGSPAWKAAKTDPAHTLKSQ